MSHLVDNKAPDFKATAVVDGQVVEDFTLSQFKGNKYVVLFFWPLDFTFVCPTEILEFQNKLADFREAGAEVIGCSTDSHFSHVAWLNTPRKMGGIEGVEALRGTFIIDKDGVVQSEVVHNLSLGRNIDETLRTLKALQFTEQHGEVCPANWNEGDKAMKPTDEGLKEYFAE